MAEEQTGDVLEEEAATGAEEVAEKPGGEKPSADEKQSGEKGILDSDEETGDKDAGGDVLSDDDDAAEDGVPDQYTLDVPEGFDESLIDTEALDRFKEQAKEAGLTQAQFQTVVQYDIQRTQDAIEQYQQRITEWKESARADKEIGGRNFDASVKNVKAVFEKFGDKEAREVFRLASAKNPNGTAAIEHPAVLRMFNRIGKALGDPELVMGEDVEKTDRTSQQLQRLYPSMHKDSA